MSEIELQVQHDSNTHRKPATNDFEIKLGSLESSGDKPQADPNFLNDASATVVFAPSRQQVKTAQIQFITLCWTLFLAGWNDSSTGPLLPRIQEVYHVSTPSNTRMEVLMYTCNPVTGGICCGFLDFRYSMRSKFYIPRLLV